MNDAEVAARMLKAGRLATAFTRLCHAKDRDMDLWLVAQAGELFEVQAWRQLALENGINVPSMKTVNMTLDVLRARAKADAAWRALEAKLPGGQADPFEGF